MRAKELKYMKILYHHRTISRDGQDVHITELIAAFRRAGHAVEIISPATNEESDFGSEGGLLSKIRSVLPMWVTELLELSYSIVAYSRLAKAAAEFEPDFIYERYNLFTLSGAWLSRRIKIPFVVEVNSPLAEERGKYTGLFWERLARWTEDYVWRAADVILPVTQVLADNLRVRGVEKHRLVVVPNGIDQAKFSQNLDDTSIRKKYGLEGRIVVGFTGFLREWHGLPNVVDALADLASETDVHFMIVGDGPAREEVEQRAKDVQFSDRLTVTGLVQRESVAEYQCAFDVAVQPQATPYASPLKLFEYMALGHAIVAPGQSNLQEVLVDGETALLFDPADVSAFKNAIVSLVQDADLRNRLGKNAAQAVEDVPYTWDGNAEKVVSLVNNLAPRSKS